MTESPDRPPRRVKIALPIFVFAEDTGELEVVTDASGAGLERHGLENVDVRAGEYSAYDMDGRVLNLTVEDGATPTETVYLSTLVDRAVRHFLKCGDHGFDTTGVRDVPSLPVDQQTNALLGLASRKVAYDQARMWNRRRFKRRHG